MMQYDIVVAYRVYPGISKHPLFEELGKFEIVKTCLWSIKKALSDLSVKFFIINDKCGPEMTSMIFSIMSTFDTEIIIPKQSGNEGTFLEQMEILRSQSFSEYIFFLEDDYLFTGESLKSMIGLLKTRKADFVSPYNHPDYYDTILHSEYFETFTYQSIRYRYSFSTTLTFLTRKDVIIETYDVLKTFKRRNYDDSIFLVLTRNRIMNLKYIIKSLEYFLNGIDRFLKIWIKIWVYTPFQALFGKKFILMTPLPSFATHLESDRLDKNINWEKLFFQYQAESTFFLSNTI